MKLIVVSGRSGSGKSTALHALEDQGFHCIDNLPVHLLPNLADSVPGAGTRTATPTGDEDVPFAVSIDAFAATGIKELSWCQCSLPRKIQ